MRNGFKFKRPLFTLRTLFLAVLLVSVILGIVSRKVRYGLRQREAVKSLIALGCGVGYGRQLTDDEFTSVSLGTEQNSSFWDEYFGLDYQLDVISIDFQELTRDEIETALPLLQDLKDLKELILTCGVSDDGLAAVGRVSTLRGLTIWGADDGTFTDGGLAELKNLSNLEEFTLFGAPRISGDGLSWLRRHSAIKRLYLNECDMLSDVVLEHLDECKSLEVLQLNGSSISDKGVSHLHCIQLRELCLSRTKVTDAIVEVVAKHTGLERLELADTCVTDAIGAALQRLSNLQIVDLSRTQVTDTSLANCGELRKLRRLWLEETRISDVGLFYLRGLQELRDLNLSHTIVTDRGVAALSGLNLELLWLNGTAVTNAGRGRME